VTAYTTVLFLHAIAIFVLTAALTIEGWMLFQLRRTSNSTEVRAWMLPLPGVTAAGISSLVIVFVTGAYLTESLKAWELAWPRFAVLEVFLFAVLGALTGRRLRAIRRLSNSVLENQSAWHSRTGSFWLKLSLSIRIWIVFGTTLLTAAKPGFRESLSIVAASVLIGWACSFATFGGQKASSLRAASSQ
jgi:hypothetical protein